MALDFEWLNHNLFYDAYARDTSFFENTPFAATGLPKGAELALLTPFKDSLPAELFTDEFHVPKTDGSGNNRPNLIRAQALLEDAGWKLKDGVRTNVQTGERLRIEFLLQQPTMEKVIGAMRQNLRKLGVEASIRYVDAAQYQKRTDAYDYDIVSIWVNRGVFFPGNEQMAMWNSAQADIRGGNNIAGVKNPAVDAALKALVSAKELPELVAAGRALDRALLWEHYVIPHWRSAGFRVAYWNKFARPSVSPKYNLGFQTWWVKQ